MTDQHFSVQHRPEESEYALLAASRDDAEATPQKIGEGSYLDVIDDRVKERILFHTSVDDGYAGRGLASQLVRFMVDESIDEGFMIVPVCPFVADWFERHSDYREHEVTPSSDHLRALRADQDQLAD